MPFFTSRCQRRYKKRLTIVPLNAASGSENQTLSFGASHFSFPSTYLTDPTTTVLTVTVTGFTLWSLTLHRFVQIVVYILCTVCRVYLRRNDWNRM